MGLLLCVAGVAGVAQRAMAEAPDTPQGGVVLEDRLYARLDLPVDAPARPRWRRRTSGTYRVWARPDGTVQRVWEVKRRRLVTEHHMDLHGIVTLSVRYEDERPTTATVNLAPAAEHDLAAWSAVAVPGATTWAPAAGDDGRHPLSHGTWWSWTDAATDVTTDAFRDSVLAGCGCALVERRATWVDGSPGVRLRLVDPDDPGHQWTVWAVPRGEQTWLAAAEVQVADEDATDAALAEARLVIGTLRWAPPPEGSAP